MSFNIKQECTCKNAEYVKYMGNLRYSHLKHLKLRRRWGMKSKEGSTNSQD